MAATNKVQIKTVDQSVFVMVPKQNRDKAKALLEAAPFYDKKAKAVVNIKEDRLLMKSDVEYLKKIIDIIYPKSRYSPTQLTAVNDDLIETGTMIRYLERDNPPMMARAVMACVMREWKNSFLIFINHLIEDEAYDSADLHEKGHVLYNHTQGYSLYGAQFKKQLEAIWDLKLAKYFENSSQNKEKIAKILFHEFSNIAQDMEINSKLFDNGEWVKAKKTMARSGVIMYHEMVLEMFDDLSGLIKDPNNRKMESKGYQKMASQFNWMVENIEGRIKGEEGDFQFCYPANKGWPEKLDWMTYMILLVKDIDNTMDQVMKNIADKLSQQGVGKGQGQGKGGQKQMSEDVINDYMDQMDADKNAEDQANANGGVGDDEDDGDDDIEYNPSGRSEGGTGRGNTGGAVQVEFETCDTFDNFTKFLRKHCLGKKNRRLNSDVLYNSNRGKFASRVVVPRRHLTERWMPTECHIIVDVSGSVPTDYVERVINAIVDTNSGIDLKNSHIIFCDTRVVSDEIMSARTKSVYAGGGTDIAEGIKYVDKKGYCRKKTDKLFIISDFEDNLHLWVEAAKEIPGIKYAIGYNVNSTEECNRKFDGGYGQRGDHGFKSEWNRVFKTVFITEQI